MSRALLAAVGISAALHTSAVAVFPWSSSPGQGLGLGAAAPDRSQLPVRMTFLMEAEAPPPSAPPPSPELPSGPSGPDAGEEAPAEDGIDARTAQQMLEVHVPASPPREEGAPEPPPTRLVFSLPPRPKAEKLAIRVEDVRWNRGVGASIGVSSKLSPELASCGLHGTVRLLLFLTPEGRIRDLRVTDPGPYAALALAAQAQVRAAEPFPPAPAGMDARLLRIPLNLHY